MQARNVALLAVALAATPADLAPLWLALGTLAEPSLVGSDDLDEAVAGTVGAAALDPSRSKRICMLVSLGTGSWTGVHHVGASLSPFLTLGSSCEPQTTKKHFRLTDHELEVSVVEWPSRTAAFYCQLNAPPPSTKHPLAAPLPPHRR